MNKGNNNNLGIYYRMCSSIFELETNGYLNYDDK